MTETITINPEEKEVQITIKPNTQVNVIELNNSKGVNQNITITVKENSTVNYQIVQNSNENALNKTQRTAFVQANARINWT
ncbi:MAG: SufD family Fe-S cluster assembly protein, partial [Candidatus Diapherotrites archaeon]|nr:SufD family Fe-S cluster assembly protein [Candidatus Diapherotrites archaeon]